MFSVKNQHSDPYTTTGLILPHTTLYISPLEEKSNHNAFWVNNHAYYKEHMAPINAFCMQKYEAFNSYGSHLTD